MIPSNFQPDLALAWAEYIADEEVRHAFAYLLGLAAVSSDLSVHVTWKGEVRDFRLLSSDAEQLYSCIANQKSLLFYVRRPALDRFPEHRLEHFASFKDAEWNNSGEIRVRLLSVTDVRELWAVLELARRPFEPGRTATTQVGYVNPHLQRCDGHRGLAGTDHLQKAYKLTCLREGCGNTYGANGTDVFQRKRPKCQDGARGLPY